MTKDDNSGASSKPSWGRTTRWVDRIGRFAPKHPVFRFILAVADIAIFNLLFYQLVRALLFQPIGYASIFDIAFWAACFAASFVTLFALQPVLNGGKVRWLLFELALIGVFLAAVATTAEISTYEKGFDFSWLRVEVVKVPLWLGIFIPLNPGFTAFFCGLVAILLWLVVAQKRSPLLWILPLLAVLATEYLIVEAFSTFAEAMVLTLMYTLFFAGPLIAASLLLVFRQYAFAFRMTPMIFHMLLMGLNYVGILPVHDSSDVVPFMRNKAAYIKEAPGVKQLFPQPGAVPDRTFSFLRTIVSTDEKVIVTYGPTCGMYSVDRKTGQVEQLVMAGLIRDMELHKESGQIWATNWKYGDLLAINPNKLAIECSVELFHLDISTPYNFVTDGDKIYITNVTYPVVAELQVNTDPDVCSVKKLRSINFYDIGYTQFTDGAYGIDLNKEANALYVSVGLLDGRNEIGLVELDLDTFEIRRDLRLPAANALLRLQDRQSMYVPVYYDDRIVEVSLESMSIVREIPAQATIVNMAHDVRRKLVYATSRTSGELLVIDDVAGEVILQMPVGAKPEALTYEADRDLLLLGSEHGLFEIDLSIFIDEGIFAQEQYIDRRLDVQRARAEESALLTATDVDELLEDVMHLEYDRPKNTPIVAPVVLEEAPEPVTPTTTIGDTEIPDHFSTLTLPKTTDDPLLELGLHLRALRDRQ